MLYALPALLFGLQAPAEDPPLIAIKNVAVVDVKEGRLLEGRTVTLMDGRIGAVGAATDRIIPTGSTILDGTGLYLMPGLFDAHVHYIAGNVFGPLMVANGVTCVRETGAFTEPVVALRDRLGRGEELGPEMIVTGAIVDGKPPVWPFSEACTTPEEGRAAVRRLAGKGVNQIKVYSRLDPETWKAIIAEAHTLGLKAIGHVPTAASMRDAVEAGQDCCEHLIGFERVIAAAAGKELAEVPGGFPNMAAWPMLPDADREVLRPFLKQMAQSGMVQSPTLVVMEGIGAMSGDGAAGIAHLEYTPPFMKAFWNQGGYSGKFSELARAAKPHMMTLVKELHDAGVPLVCGTDLANPNVVAGFSLHREMELFQEAGIPAADVLRYATLGAARLCDLEKRLGTVEAGKTASLVLLRKNPLEDVRNAAEIEAVFLRGRYFDRKALDKLLAEALALCGG